MGNPLLDISANVEQPTLDEWGVKLNDAILAADKHVPLSDTHTALHTPHTASQNITTHKQETTHGTHTGRMSEISHTDRSPLFHLFLFCFVPVTVSW